MERIDRYFDGRSLIHRWDPRVKLLSLGIFCFSTVFLPDIRLSLLSLAFSLSLLFISRVRIRALLGYIKWVLIFMLFFFLTMPFTVEGQKIFSVFGFSFTLEGLELAILISTRALAVILIFFLILSSTRFEDIIKALYSLRFPNKLVQIIMFSYRYIFVLMDEARRTWDSMRVRGFNMGFFPRLGALKSLGFALGMLFIRSYERSERVLRAMVSRGYTGRVETLNDFELKKRDVILGIGVFIFAALVQVLRLWIWM